MRLTIAVLVASLSFAPAVFAADEEHHCHEFTLHATDDPILNGEELVDFVNHIKDATAIRPYVIHLEAGTYTLSTPIVLLPWISLKGSGMTSTVIQAANASMYQVVFFQDQVATNYVQALSNEGLANLTIIGVQPVSVTVNGFFTMDHVQLISTNNNVSCIDLITVGSHFFITDSLIGGLELDSPTITSTGSSPVSSIIGSEVDVNFQEASPVFTIACIADYNAAGAAVSTACH